MANSRRFVQLEKRLNNIETLYMPQVRSNGNYTKKETDNLRAYLLLAHAEIESFFEEVSEDKAKKAFAKWRNNRIKSNVLLSLVSFCNKEQPEYSIEQRVNSSLSTYIHSLRKNNGIKEKNILKILLPIGYEYDDLDNTWLNTISSFGTSRGEVAHTSSRVQQPIDPLTIKNTILIVMNEIRDIDLKLKGIA